MKHRFPISRFVLPALMLALLAPNPAAAQSQAQWNSLYDRIIRVEAAVRNMQGQAYGQGAGAAQPQNPQNSAQLNLRISSLEDQVRQLLGSVERLTREMQQSRQDNELRLRRLETAAREGRLRGKLKQYADAGSTRAGAPATGGSSLGTLSISPLPNQGGTSHTGGLPTYDQGALDNMVQDELVFESEPVLDSQTYDPNTSTSTVIGAAPPATPGSNSSRVQAPGPTTLGTITMSQGGTVTGGSVNTLPSTRDVVEKRTLDGNQVAALNTGSGPELLYEQAYENMLGRRFGAAEAGFEQFLSQHKRHKLAPKAQYWLGETHYARKDYRNAARAFLLGYKSYKKNAMAPTSLVKLGMSLRKMGQKEQACATFSQVRSEFPKAKSEVKLAGKESRRAGC